jgi:hypothetical protein
MSKIQIEEGYKEAAPRQSITYDYGKVIVPDNISVGGLEARITFFVTATADDGTGLATAAQQALLDGVNLTVKTGKKSGGPERTPIDTERIGALLHDSWRLLERDAIGGVGSSTGLQKALLAGVNELQVTVPISLAHVEFIREAGQLFGLGAPQLLDMSAVIKVDPEMLNDLDSNVVLTKVGVDLRVIEAEDSEGDRECLIPEIVEVKGNSEDSVTGPDGMTLSAEQWQKPLTGGGASTIDVLSYVKVGGKVVAEDPATPTDIQYAYERDPNTGAVEKALATKRTPLYLVPQSPIAKIPTGPVTIKMRDHDEDLVVRFLVLPLLNHDEVMGRIKRRAGMLQDNEEIHAVNTHMVENLGDSVNPEQIPFVGWTYFTKDDPRFHELPGIRCKKGGKPYVRLPLKDLVAGHTAYRLALQDSEGAAVATVGKYLRYLPGGFVSTKGLIKGGKSRVALDLQNQLSNAPSQIKARTAEQKAA